MLVDIAKAQRCINEARDAILFMYQVEDHVRGNSAHFENYSKLAHESRIEIKEKLQKARELLEV